VKIYRARLLLSLIIGIVVISCAATFVRFAQAENVPTLSIATCRSLTTYVALAYSVTVLPLLAIVLVGRKPMFGFGPAAYGWMQAVGLVPRLIGHWRLSCVLGEAVTWSTGGGAIPIPIGIYSASWAELGGTDREGV
jgi:hypothetical protein